MTRYTKAVNMWQSTTATEAKNSRNSQDWGSINKSVMNIDSQTATDSPATTE